MGALLAAPLLSQNAADPKVKDGAVVWFSLSETRADILKQLGPPAMIADFGMDYQSWQYHIGNHDHHDFSHYLVFRRSTGTLISVTRAYEDEQIVDDLFPRTDTAVHFLGDSAYGARVRRLTGSRLLIAMGSTNPGRPTNQLMLIAETELPHFHKWLHERMRPGTTAQRAK